MKRYLVLTMSFVVVGCMCPPWCFNGAVAVRYVRTTILVHNASRNPITLMYQPSSCYAYPCCSWKPYIAIAIGGAVTISCEAGQAITFKYSPDGNVCGQYATSFTLTGYSNQKAELFLN